MVKVEGRGKFRGEILEYHRDSLLIIKTFEGVVENIYLNSSMGVDFLVGSRREPSTVDLKKLKIQVQLGPAMGFSYERIGLGEIRINPSWNLHHAAQPGIGVGMDIFEGFNLFHYYAALYGSPKGSLKPLFYNLRMGIADVSFISNERIINNLKPFYEFDLGLRSLGKDKVIFLYSLGMKWEQYTDTRINWWNLGERTTIHKMQMVTFRIGIIF